MSAEKTNAEITENYLDQSHFYYTFRDFVSMFLFSFLIKRHSRWLGQTVKLFQH